MKNPFRFTGRATRAEFLIANVIAIAVIAAVTSKIIYSPPVFMKGMASIGNFSYDNGILITGMWLSVFLILLVFLAATTARRLHDCNEGDLYIRYSSSSDFQLIAYLVMYFFLAFQSGAAGSNAFGPDPLESE